LFSGDEASCCGDDLRVVSERLDDVVGLGEFSAGVGCCEEELDGAACEGGGLAGLPELAEGGNRGDWDLFLTEAVAELAQLIA
jgi:hypothetical protein